MLQKLKKENVFFIHFILSLTLPLKVNRQTLRYRKMDRILTEFILKAANDSLMIHKIIVQNSIVLPS